ncbi:MAG: quinol dehydrogenase ferredoxin subunit NapH [Deltaproteobacteria bacterium]|nr:quinol dehydrogenase ferredoxin subunit NapH [Deltaproteobacteria bacterium]
MTSTPRKERYLLARRIIQLGVPALFILGYRFDLGIGGRELIQGNLSASRILDALPLADPLAVSQLLLTGRIPHADVLWGALVVILFYWVLGGRAFCSWVCPVNIIGDSASWLRARLDIPPGFTLPRQLRYGLLALALFLSALTGVAAFEWVSPVGIIQRGLIYGMGLGWLAVAGLFLFDLLVLRHGWCGHMCPLGAFYSLVGRFSLLRIRFQKDTCTSCGKCHRVCPEPQVLALKPLAQKGRVLSGNCTNCARCIEVCPEGSLSFAPRWKTGEELQQPGTKKAGPVRAA